MGNSVPRRRFLQVMGTSMMFFISGCSSIRDILRGGNKQGEIVLISDDHDWLQNKELRVIGSSDGEKKIDITLTLPAQNTFYSVESGTYNMSVFLEDESVGTHKWAVSDCKSQFQINFPKNRNDSIHLGTSDC